MAPEIVFKALVHNPILYTPEKLLVEIKNNIKKEFEKI